MVGVIHDGINAYIDRGNGIKELMPVNELELSYGDRKLYHYKEGVLEISVNKDGLEALADRYGGTKFEKGIVVRLPTPIGEVALIPGVLELKILETDNPVYRFKKRDSVKEITQKQSLLDVMKFYFGKR